MSSQPLLMFSTHSYQYLSQSMCALGGFEEGQLERRSFPDGESYARLLTECADRDVAVLGGTISAADTLEVYDLACGLVEYGARRLTLVIPFYGYGTMERAVKSGEVVTAKTRARLLSAIPAASMGNRVILLDLHVSGITHYFEGAIRPMHVYAKPLIEEAAQELGGDDFVLACTDAGRAKWVASLASGMGVIAAFVYKRRIDGKRTEVTGVSAHVCDKKVIIYDDMIRTGGSLIGAAHAYRDAGARSIAAIATHGLFPGDALVRLEQSGLFETIVCTDSHPRSRELRSGFLRVVSVDELLVNQLRETV
ncbi:MAG: ribose-phosphate diphosphokinase [Proteobacteria bacterium]|nr:ribose-phosphate diphosphokinase [Pseudomonadota bacterium]